MNNSKRTLSLGFIGGSIRSAVGYTHQIAAQMDGRWELVAGCFSQNNTVNRETGARWGIDNDRVYLTADALLTSERARLDAVVVLTPTPSHSQLVIQALNAGYSVICEKALAVSSQEIEQILKAERSSKKRLVVTLNYSGYPMVRELKSLIEAGRLGKILQVQIEMPQEGFVRLDIDGEKTKPQAWRLQDDRVPTISLDLGVHLHHMVHFLTGEKPIQVVADQSSFGWFEDVVDNVMCLIRYSGGLRCQMWYSKSALGHRNGLKVRVYGDQASAEWCQLRPEDLTMGFIDGSRTILDRASQTSVTAEPRYNRFKAGHPAGFIEAFANLYSDAADSLLGYERNSAYSSPYVFGAEHALEGLKLFEAVEKSFKTGSWQKVSV